MEQDRTRVVSMAGSRAVRELKKKKKGSKKKTKAQNVSQKKVQNVSQIKAQNLTKSVISQKSFKSSKSKGSKNAKSSKSYNQYERELTERQLDPRVDTRLLNRDQMIIYTYTQQEKLLKKEAADKKKAEKAATRVRRLWVDSF